MDYSLDLFGMLCAAYVKFKQAAGFGEFNQFMLRACTIGLKIDHRMRVCGFHMQNLSGLHFIEYNLGLEDGQGAIQPLGIQSFIKMYPCCGWVFFRQHT